MRKKTVLIWSSGKDSAWALYLLRQNPLFEVSGLFTVINQESNRAPMHSTRVEMLQRQSDAIGLPISFIYLPDPCTNEQSDSIMGRFVAESAITGIEYMAFGDLFLEDIRAYRNKQLKGSGIEALFPCWGIPTITLAQEMLSSGIEAYISSIDSRKLPTCLVGKKWTNEIIEEFPAGCDPCGENGEFHTVVVAGPMFQRSISVEVGKIYEQNGFAYADIIPIDGWHA